MNNKKEALWVSFLFSSGLINIGYVSTVFQTMD